MSSHEFEEIEDLNSEEEDQFVTDSDESDKEDQSFVTAFEKSIINDTPSSLTSTTAFSVVKKGYKGQLYRTQVKKKKTNSQAQKFAQIVGNGEFSNLLAEFQTYNKDGKKDIAQRSMANGVISKIRYKFKDKGITDRMIQEVFSIGSGRLNLIKKGNVYQLHPFKFNAKAISDEDIKNLLNFTSTIPYEPGYPCQHSRIKKYIEHDNVQNLSDLYPLYCTFTSNLKCRKMESRTFHRYLVVYEPDLKTKRSKQDVCDLCIKIKVALQSKDLTAEERDHLLKIQEKHMIESRTQRILMRQVNYTIILT